MRSIQMLGHSLEDLLASYVETLGVPTPTIGPYVSLTGLGTESMKWSLYADDAMTKCIGVIELSVKLWR